ncbi:carbon-nitrogen hydrolase family protein [Urbifossiella limnaea]|uniref:(R)-stereoselective amidase n=1 Tax=Urbifossiella limnaea TaxID=2528023 RepID=A0A517XLL5_9BACT|nr:carbon-nitrogen hydrolase family protein [Urbifossiella limnaea]QDU18401.1 (R)-stereoselective amidase [Urbifossiella limnaea]
MHIALASPRVAATVADGLAATDRLLAAAAAQGARIVCFPEAYLPGLRGLDFPVPPFGRAEQERVVGAATEMTRRHGITAVLGMEWHTDLGRHIAAVVIDAQGHLVGVQTKNQLDPSEEPLYVPGRTRRLFTVEGLTFGVAICHEGFRYPETVRWAAARGAKVVFHPHCTGSDLTGTVPRAWGDPAGPYYEKAVMCRALENTVYVASANYAFRYPESATTLIGPQGGLVAHLPYGEEGVLVCDVDLDAATGLLAKRYAPERYGDGA